MKLVNQAIMVRGINNVLQLEDIAERYKELVHQLRLREQAILRKFDIEITNDDYERI